MVKKEMVHYGLSTFKKTNIVFYSLHAFGVKRKTAREKSLEQLGQMTILQPPHSQL
jgi:hypothetical protein